MFLNHSCQVGGRRLSDGKITPLCGKFTREVNVVELGFVETLYYSARDASIVDTSHIGVQAG